MASITPSVALWVKSEPFSFGCLPIPPHPKLTVSNIKKILAYAKGKGKTGFPRLSYTVWKHIAIAKLQIPMDLAWTYFSTFLQVGQESSVQERLDLDAKFATATTQQQIELVRSSMSVHTLKFILFLYIQLQHKISLRASLVSGSDEWPTRARSPDLDSRAPGSTKVFDENSYTTFVLSNLTEIMELLVEPDSYMSADGNDLTLSTDALEALGFLLDGSIDRNRTIKPLLDIALIQQVHQKSGYSKMKMETSRGSRGIKLVISRSFSFRNLQSWLRSHIVQNPFGISSCITNGRRLSWPLSGEDQKADGKRGRIATNTPFVPRDNVKGNKIIIMSQVCKQTIAKSSGTLEHASVKVHRCHNSFIYLLSPLRSVSIEKCRHSTIVLGAVETTLHVSHCENTTVIAACRRFSTSGSMSCTYHLVTPFRPLIYGSNERLVLGPYHTNYQLLSTHMAKVGLTTQPNLWDNPLMLGPDHTDDNPPWEIMNPKDFYVFTIPFEIEGKWSECDRSLLPTRYQKALRERERTVEQWQKLVKEAGLTKEQKKHFQSIVESRFQEWLQDRGHKLQLDCLAVTPSAAKK